jgi:ribosome biogenesis protein SSF1/2
MNNFNTPDANEHSRVPKRLESLSTTVFQSLFPPINPQATPLTSIRRVMMLNREKTSTDGSEEDGYVVSLRHYAIATRKTGVSKRIRRLDPTEQRNTDRKKGLPNLGKLEDVADYLLDPASGGYTSASETELDTDAEVEITENTTKRVLNRREVQRMKKDGDKPAEKQAASKPNVEKRAVKLVELGPRMKLKLMKVEEGMCNGRIMWHNFISKSERDVKKMDDEWNRRKRQKEARKKQQKANIEKKKEEKAKAKANGQAADNEDDEDVSMDDDDYDQWESDDFDEDAEVEGDDEDESMEE